MYVHILTKMHSPPLKGNFFEKHEKLWNWP